MRIVGTFIAILLTLCTMREARAQEHLYSVSFSGGFTTSSKLFRQPGNPDEFVRSEYLPLNDLFSAGIDVRRTIEELRIQLGLSIEYITKTEDRLDEAMIPVRDGFTAIPLELSGYFMIPVGSERVQVYMGAGAGAYFGRRNFAKAFTDAMTVERSVGYGIHILGGFQYALNPSLGLRSELKFRDVQFETVNAFSAQTVDYLGTSVVLNPDRFSSRVNIDGMLLSLGLVYSF